MSRQLLIVTFVVAALMMGCRPKPLPAPVPERVELASPSDLDSLRELYHKNYPESQVGVVIATKPEAHLVGVGGIDVSKMAEGQIVTFIDAHQKTLGTGRIVRVLPDSVHVSVDPNARRDLVVGDLMVRF
jgi:hypothetical protein